MSKQLIISMENLDLHREEDALKFAYSILELQENVPEVAIGKRNPKSQQDLFAAIYNKPGEVGFKEFSEKYYENNAGIMITIATDSTDKHRIGFMILSKEFISKVNLQINEDMPLVITTVYDAEGERVLPFILDELNTIIENISFQ